MTVLITGGTGFVGSHVARKLVDKGRRVVIYDIHPNLNTISDFKDKITLVRGDILDTIKLWSTIKDYDIEYIIHLAYLLVVTSRENPAQAIKINCEGTTNVFDVARLTDVKRVVWTSSSAVYGPSHYYARQPVDEDDLLLPADVYSACKLLNERVAQNYFAKYGFDNVGLRPTNVYGAGRSTGATAFVNDLITKPSRDEPAKLFRSWRGVDLDWVYVEDLAEAFISACYVKEPKHRIFNAGSGQLHTIDEALGYVRELIPDAVYEEVNAPFEMTNNPLIKTLRIREELGFKPRSLKEGVQDTVYKTRRQESSR
jgi:nucleoside-diphosphate-sugar epimerase